MESVIPNMEKAEENYKVPNLEKDVRDVTLRSLRKCIGIVQQDVYLFNGTVAENIAYGNPSATREDVVKAATAAGVNEFVDKMSDGYDTVVGERGVKLSGGQKQRIRDRKSTRLNSSHPK